jgi:hypothetical protein
VKLNPRDCLVHFRGAGQPAADGYEERATAKTVGAPRTSFRRDLAGAGKPGVDPVLSGYEIRTTATKIDKSGVQQVGAIEQQKARGPEFEMPARQRFNGGRI